MNRIIVYISTTAKLTLNNEAIKKQAESTSRAANDLMKSAGKKAIEDDKLQEKANQLKRIQEEISLTNGQMEEIKNQAVSIQKQYDELLAEHESIKNKLKSYE